MCEAQLQAQGKAGRCVIWGTEVLAQEGRWQLLTPRGHGFPSPKAAGLTLHLPAYGSRDLAPSLGLGGVTGLVSWAKG